MKLTKKRELNSNRTVTRKEDVRNAKIYSSIKEAADDANLSSSSTIIRVCQGIKKSSRGYQWYYTDEIEKETI